VLCNVEVERAAGSPALLLSTDEHRRVKLDCSTVQCNTLLLLFLVLLCMYLCME
jgi:hypothetical protein